MVADINPNDFIITRKRKKYRFAKFALADNCYEIADWKRRAVDTIEIGAGTGVFSVELAARHPERQFVALDVKGDRLQKGAHVALDEAVANVGFLRARADQIIELFDEHSAQSIWLTFPDPFPKRRSAGRRLTHPTFLKKCETLLDDDGALYLKHDNRVFFQWSLEQLVSQGWVIDELSFDLHESTLNDDYKILTAYERRWLAEGLVTNFLRARPPRA